MTPEDAESQDYIVDRHCYPWVAYRGPRFSPTDIFAVETPGYAPTRTGGEILRDLKSENFAKHRVKELEEELQWVWSKLSKYGYSSDDYR